MSIIECPQTRDEFKKLIQQNSNKVIIIKGSASWCGPCKKCKDFVYLQFASYNTPNKLFIEVDVDKHSDVASYLRIRKLPTLLSYKDGMPNQASFGASEPSIETFFKKSFS